MQTLCPSSSEGGADDDAGHGADAVDEELNVGDLDDTDNDIADAEGYKPDFTPNDKHILSDLGTPAKAVLLTCAPV